MALRVEWRGNVSPLAALFVRSASKVGGAPQNRDYRHGAPILLLLVPHPRNDDAFEVGIVYYH
jgi:hypothetical protein